MLLLCVMWGAATLGMGQVLPLQTYTTKDGLVSNFVNTFCQDSRGYLWIATDIGVSVFDGSVFRNYTEADGLGDGFVNSIMESKTSPGTMWIATNSGVLTKLEGSKFTRYHIGTSQKPNRVNSVCERSDGERWWVTEEGILIEHDGTFKAFHPGAQLGSVDGVAEAVNDAILILSSTGLWLYTPANGKIVPVRENGHICRNVGFIRKDADGDVWALTSDSSFAQILDDRLVKRYRFREGIPLSFMQDHAGFFWVGTSGALVRFPKSHISEDAVTRYTTDNGLFSNSIPPGFEDRENNLWFGSYGKGMSRLKENFSISIPVPQGTGRGVMDSRGHLWLLTNLGLLEFWKGKSSSWERAFHPLESRNRQLDDIHASYSGELSIRFTNGEFISYSVDGPRDLASRLIPSARFIAARDAPRPGVLSFLSDSKGRLWYSVDGGGVAVVDLKSVPSRTRVFTKEEGLPDKDVRVIYEDREGNIWMGGLKMGVSELKASDVWTGAPREFTAAEESPQHGIRSIFEDSGGNIWLGTLHGGLASYQHGRFSSFAGVDELPSDLVFCIAEGMDRKLWVGTQGGMCSSRGKEPVRFVRDINFPEEPIYSCGVGEDGAVWAVTRNAVTLYPPSTGAQQAQPPPVYITEVEINGIRKSVEEELSLPYYDNSCRIEFSGISLSAGPSVRFRYMLKGADNDWHILTGGRSVTYASLRPGSYTFSVLAENIDGLLSPQAATILMTVTPPYWQRWWFIGIVLVTVGTALYGLMQYRLSHALRIERMRGRIATDLHDDIGSSLTRIALFSDAAAREAGRIAGGGAPTHLSSDRMTSMLGEIGTVSRELIDAMNDIVWSVNPRNDSFENLTLRMKDYTSRTMAAAGIDYVFDISPELSSLVLPLDVRRHLYLLFKEAMNNVVRHSRAKSVQLILNRRDADFIMVIRDDGIGFEPDSPGFGNGLVNMKKRASLINGFLNLSAQPKTGTEVKLIFRIP